MTSSGPTGPTEIQFNSIDNCAFTNNISGTRSRVIVAGLGSSQISSTSDPITLPIPAISIKTFSGGTITDIAIILTITLGNADAATSVVHARIYRALNFDSSQFYPIDDTEMEINLPMFPEIGATFLARLSNLAIEIQPNTQLVLGLYNTTVALQYSFSAHVSAVVSMK